MATPSGRKKSIISTISNGTPNELQIQQPVANNSLLNKQASTTTGLYQRCSTLRSRLLRLPNFADYFAAASPPESSRRSTDPVTQMWDLLALGVPLVHLWNHLGPPYDPIPVESDFEVRSNLSIQTRKRMIALFCMQAQRKFEKCDKWTVTELLSDRSTTDGFVKVIHTVSVIVDALPDSAFTEPPASPPPSLVPTESSESLATDDQVQPMPPSAQEAARNHIVREIVETERKYVQDLELMQRYAQALASVIDQDTIHHLFPNLKGLLNFQRKFLIRLEGIAEQPWREQHWGLAFIENEEDFAVYEPYCANYTHAADLMLQEEQNLTNDLINAKSELPAFLIKPVQRICKYPLLLDSLIKATSPADYAYLDELKEGTAAAKRITDKINEAQRRAENRITVKHLEMRVEDWKGHHLSNFGDLLLDDIFVVTKSDVDREYHVFLFEKIILCCKELYHPPVSAKKVNKSNSLLKKQQPPPALALPGGVGPPKQKNTPLLLKGRIFLSNVTQAILDPRARPGEYALAVWWSGEEDLEFFTLRCRTEEQYTQWQTQINRLIKDIATRRASERSSGLNRMAAQLNYNSTSPSLTSARSGGMYPPSAMQGMPSARSMGSSRGSTTVYGSDDGGWHPQTGPNGYPTHNGFDGEESDDLYEHYPPSGRNTAMSMRREQNRSLGGWDDDSTLGGSSYRSSGYSAASPQLPNGVPAGLPSGPASRTMGRPSMSRLTSNASGASYSSDGSFSNGQQGRPTLKSKFSTTRLQPAYEAGESGAGPHASMPPAARGQQYPPTRSRSASQPSAYVPKQGPAPPLPSGAPWAAGHERSPSTATAQQAYSGSMQQQQQQMPSAQGKRGSGSSQSTAASSMDGYSPNTASSPTTPYGSGDSSNGSGGFEHMFVKVKVYYDTDIFAIQVPYRLEYADLLEKVGKKIRLCTGQQRELPSLRMRYQDEDGDMISLSSTEDVQMAFEQFRPGGQVIIYVS